jgi:hypothetical protein
MQAFVLDSPRTSFIAATSPDLEIDEGGYSRRPSYVTNQPQLYPYTLSDDDIWAEQMVSNILAVRGLVVTTPVGCLILFTGPLPYQSRLTVIKFQSLILLPSL